MSERAERTGEQGGEPLFQKQEEQERIYAPEQVPGSDIPETEQDRGGTAAESTAAASDQDDDEPFDVFPGRGSATG
jgi:hypothetical protein